MVGGLMPLPRGRGPLRAITLRDARRQAPTWPSRDRSFALGQAPTSHASAGSCRARRAAGRPCASPSPGSERQVLKEWATAAAFIAEWNSAGRKYTSYLLRDDFRARTVRSAEVLARRGACRASPGCATRTEVRRRAPRLAPRCDLALGPTSGGGHTMVR